MTRSRQIISFALIALCVGLFLAPLRTSAQEQTTAPIDSTRYIRLIDSCFTAVTAGDYAAAEAFLAEALRLNPPAALQPMLLNNLGGLQLLQGKDDAALLSFSSALSKVPTKRRRASTAPSSSSSVRSTRQPSRTSPSSSVTTRRTSSTATSARWSTC